MARIAKRTLADCHQQKRGWGREHWIENIPEYCGKVLVIDPHKKGSLHLHRQKKETMLVLAGTLLLRLIDTETAQEYFQTLSVDESILIPQCQPHQIINHGDGQLVLAEFSTQHFEDDSLRLEKGD